MNYFLIDSTEILKSLNFNENYPIFADIESKGLYVDPLLIQIYQPEKANVVFIIDLTKVPLKDAIDFLKPYHLVFHNAAYDLGTLNFVPKAVDDTLYASRIAFPAMTKYSLDEVAKVVLGYDIYQKHNLAKTDMQKSFKKGITEENLLYAAIDVVAIYHIWRDKRIQEVIKNSIAYQLDIVNLRYAIIYQQNGLLVDQKLLKEKLEEINKKIEANKKYIPINPNSSQQVCKYLKIPSSNKATLVKLANEGNKLAELILQQRALLKTKSFLEAYNYPKVYTKFNPAGAATGRFTASGGDLENGINAQQIPRHLQYLFKQDTENTVVIAADYSTAELRAGAAIMGDLQMYKELKAGLDLHKIAATFAVGGRPEDITPEDRQKGKAISFGFIYGMSAKTFQEYAYTNYGVKFSYEEALEIKKNYESHYPAIAAYAKYWWENYKRKPAQTPLGHRSFVRIGTEAINYAVQGAIAETIKLAIHYLVRISRKELSQNQADAIAKNEVIYGDALNYIYNVVHDAIYLRVPRGQEDYWASLLIKAMKMGWQRICQTPMFKFKDIPMPVEIEYFSTTKNNKISKKI